MLRNIKWSSGSDITYIPIDLSTAQLNIFQICWGMFSGLVASLSVDVEWPAWSPGWAHVTYKAYGLFEVKSVQTSLSRYTRTETLGYWKSVSLASWNWDIQTVEKVSNMCPYQQPTSWWHYSKTKYSKSKIGVCFIHQCKHTFLKCINLLIYYSS